MMWDGMKIRYSITVVYGLNPNWYKKQLVGKDVLLLGQIDTVKP